MDATSQEFSRTVSRLIEMRSRDYMAEAPIRTAIDAPASRHGGLTGQKHPRHPPRAELTALILRRRLQEKGGTDARCKSPGVQGLPDVR